MHGVVMQSSRKKKGIEKELKCQKEAYANNKDKRKKKQDT